MRSALLLAGLAGAVAAQPSAIIITDFPATFIYQSYPTTTSDSGGRATWSAGGSNHLAANWWYYCIAGDTTGSAFNSSGSQMTAVVSADRKTGTLEWLNADSRNFDARLVNCVHKVTSTSGVSAQTMTITNNNITPLNITLYTYADLDLNGFGGDDSCAQAAGAAVGQQRVTDASALCFFMGQSYNAWEVAAWPVLRDRIIAGQNGQCYSLANSGLPFGPGDYSGAFSWTLTIPPNSSASVRALLSVSFQPPSNNTASAVPFGAAKAGTNGLPVWTLNRPFAGSATALEITNGLAGSAPLLMIGSTQTNLPFPPFGTAYVLPLATVSMPAFNAGNISKITLNVPAVAAGLAHFQALWADPGAAGGVAHTDGLTWTIGSY